MNIKSIQFTSALFSALVIIWSLIPLSCWTYRCLENWFINISISAHFEICMFPVQYKKVPRIHHTGNNGKIVFMRQLFLAGVYVCMATGK